MNVDQRFNLPPGYDAARLTALAAPLDPDHEVRALQRAVPRLQCCFDLGMAEAEAIALRCVLFGRDRRLHETLTLMAEPSSLRSIVDAAEIEGIDHLDSNSRGCLFVAFHYGPYSSLLWLALARAAAVERIPRITFLLNRQLDPNLVMPRNRWDVLVEHDILRPQAFVPFDLTRHGISASRALANTVANGGSLLIMPDAWFVPADARTASTCHIGQRTVGFPRGADWLARQAECEVVAVRIQPDHQGHRIVLEPVVDVAAAMTVLGAAISNDPAPWEGWTRDQPFF